MKRRSVCCPCPCYEIFTVQCIYCENSYLKLKLRLSLPTFAFIKQLIKQIIGLNMLCIDYAMIGCTTCLSVQRILIYFRMICIHQTKPKYVLSCHHEKKTRNIVGTGTWIRGLLLSSPPFPNSFSFYSIFILVATAMIMC